MRLELFHPKITEESLFIIISNSNISHIKVFPYFTLKECVSQEKGKIMKRIYKRNMKN
jgi:hypothetical protein